MFDQRRHPRSSDSGPLTFRLRGIEAPGTLVNLSASGALFRFDTSLPFGQGDLGQAVVFTSFHDVGALLRPRAEVIRYFEEPGAKFLAVKYLPD